jgi:hypothetical protein
MWTSRSPEEGCKRGANNDILTDPSVSEWVLWLGRRAWTATHEMMDLLIKKNSKNYIIHQINANVHLPIVA